MDIDDHSVRGLNLPLCPLMYCAVCIALRTITQKAQSRVVLMDRGCICTCKCNLYNRILATNYCFSAFPSHQYGWRTTYRSQKCSSQVWTDDVTKFGVACRTCRVTAYCADQHFLAAVSVSDGDFHCGELLIRRLENFALDKTFYCRHKFSQ